jgi:type I restriction enzyme, R subunit
MPQDEAHSEWLTRKQRIDPHLDTLGWRKPNRSLRGAYRLEEYETDNGPADYALCCDADVLGIVGAKELSLGPQNVLTQAKRYARGATRSPFNFGGLRVPFLYSTSGEVIWFHDVRHELNRSRKIAGFHTPAALREMLERDFQAACEVVQNTPNNHPRLRPYQIEANADLRAARYHRGERGRELLRGLRSGS